MPVWTHGRIEPQSMFGACLAESRGPRDRQAQAERGREQSLTVSEKTPGEGPTERLLQEAHSYDYPPVCGLPAPGCGSLLEGSDLGQ